MIEQQTIGQCTLWLGDCAEVLPALSHGFDALVTDPPYGINENSKKAASRGRKNIGARDYGGFDWDKQPIDADLMDVLRAQCRHQIIFGGNYYDLPPTSCWLVWDKKNGASDFADCELAWTNLNKAVRKFDWLWNGMIRQGNEARFHPTQKPLAVMQWVLTQLPQNVNSVLDPFMGSGTTGVACAMAGNPFVGIERDPRYFELACRRIEDAYLQPSLLDVPAVESVQEALL